MKTTLVTTLAVIVLTATTAYAQQCTCSTAKIENGWCGECEVGHVTGIKISSKKLYDALDGKEITDASKITCTGCRTALAEDATCDHCKVGFAHKKAYKSMPAYRLAIGHAEDPAKIKCPTCRTAAADQGWCDACNQGLVANHVFKDKDAYNEAVKARETVRLAAQTATKCESCAVAMVTDGDCAACKVSFKDGKMVKSTDKKMHEKP